MVDSASCIGALCTKSEQLVEAIDCNSSNEITLIQRFLVAMQRAYKEGKGNDLSIKESLTSLAKFISGFRVEVEDDLLTQRQKRLKWSHIKRKAYRLNALAKKKYEEIQDDINTKADNQSSHTDIIRHKVRLLAMTGRSKINSLKDLEKEIENSGGSLATMRSQLEHLVGPVGIPGKNLPKTPETSRMVQKLNRAVDDSHTEKFLTETSKHDYKALKAVQSQIAKLPKKLHEGQATTLVKGPVFVTTTPFIRQADIDKEKINATQIFPGWLFEDQLLLAYNPKADLSHLKDESKSGRKSALTIHDRIADVIESLNARSPHPYMDLTEGEPLAIPGNRLRFLWLMPIYQYEGLGNFAIESVGFPKSSELIDPESKSRAQHEHDTLIHLKNKKDKEDKATTAARNRRLAMEKAAEPLVKVLLELEKQEKEVREKLKPIQVEMKALRTTIDFYKQEAVRATPQQKAQLKKSIEEAMKHLDAASKKYEVDRYKMLVPLRTKKRELSEEIAEVQSKFRRK